MKQVNLLYLNDIFLYKSVHAFCHKMDPFVSCPYNNLHRVPQSRIQAHIVKCQTKHPELIMCPYNATHRMSQSELKYHVMTCPSRKEMFPDDRSPMVIAKTNAPKAPQQKAYLPHTDPNQELWDD